MSTLTADTVDELKAWRLKLLKAEAAGSVDAAVLCWRRINFLLDGLPEQRAEIEPDF